MTARVGRSVFIQDPDRHYEPSLAIPPILASQRALNRHLLDEYGKFETLDTCNLLDETEYWIRRASSYLKNQSEPAFTLCYKRSSPRILSWTDEVGHSHEVELAGGEPLFLKYRLLWDVEGLHVQISDHVRDTAGKPTKFTKELIYETPEQLLAALHLTAPVDPLEPGYALRTGGPSGEAAASVPGDSNKEKSPYIFVSYRWNEPNEPMPKGWVQHNFVPYLREQLKGHRVVLDTDSLVEQSSMGKGRWMAEMALHAKVVIIVGSPGYVRGTEEGGGVFAEYGWILQRFQRKEHNVIVVMEDDADYKSSVPEACRAVVLAHRVPSEYNKLCGSIREILKQQDTKSSDDS